MSMRRILATIVAAGALCVPAGCSMAMRQVPVTASHAQWQALAGEWHGTYRMDGYDRQGTIAFKLVAVEQQASGEVLMIPARTGWPYTANRPTSGDLPPSAEPRTELLTIRFVEVAGGVLSGTMDPYWDPDRKCTAHASFTGTVEGDLASGTVTSVCENDVKTLRGEWRARRAASQSR
jgi:hypothetical protein